MQFEFHDLSADAARAADAVRLVRRLFTCDYAHIDEYLQVSHGNATCCCCRTDTVCDW